MHQTKNKEKTNNVRIFFAKHGTKIILFSISFFAMHWIFFINYFKLNVPYGFDWSAVQLVYEYMITDKFPVGTILTPIANHLLLFPYLIMIPNLYFNSFDVVNMYFLQWPILVTTLFFTYLIIKITNKAFFWFLIPISAFIFNPLITSSQHVFPGWQFVIPPLAITVIIFLLSQATPTRRTFTASLILAIVATFSNVFGIVAWIAGIACLIKYDKIEKKLVNKKLLALWILSMFSVGLVYYSLALQEGSLEVGKVSPFSLKGMTFITTFLATPFRLKYDVIMNSVGIISIILSILCLIYFLKHPIKHNIKPWFVFLLVGISSAIIAELGRAHLEFHEGNETYYIQNAQFFQVGLLILGGIIVQDIIYNRKKNSFKILGIIIILFMISQSVLLVPSYYTGWLRAAHYFTYKQYFMNCFSLTSDLSCTNESEPLNASLNYEMINFFLKNRFSFFGDNNFNKQNIKDIQQFEQIWAKKDTRFGFGQIETINGIDVSTNNLVYVEKPLMIIKGWILDENKNDVDSIYLLIDDKPFLKYDEFLSRSDIINNLELHNNLKPGWIISFLSEYVEDGCHKLTVVGLKNNNKIMLDREAQICKT